MEEVTIREHKGSYIFAIIFLEHISLLYGLLSFILEEAYLNGIFGYFFHF